MLNPLLVGFMHNHFTIKQLNLKILINQIRMFHTGLPFYLEFDYLGKKRPEKT